MITINGRILNNSTNNFACEKVYDERKLQSGTNIEKIFVEANIGNVNFFTTDLTDFDIRLNGKVFSTNDIVLNVKTLGNKLKVDVDFNGSSINGNLTLDVAVPQKVYNEIFVSTISGNIDVKEDVKVHTLKAESMSGSVHTRASLKEMAVDTMNGKVTAIINAKNDISIKISTMNGNVNAELNNIGRIDISTSTMNGRVRKPDIKVGRHSIKGTISTMNGNINIE